MQSKKTRPEPSETARRPWTAPELRHLAASEAEFGAVGLLDAEGLS